MQGRLVAAVALAVLVTALATESPLLLRLAYILWGSLAVAAGLTWSSLRWLELERHTRARRAEVGGLTEETLRIRNSGWLPKLWIEVRDASDLPGHRAGRVITALGRGQVRSWTVRTRCRRRGMFTLGPMKLVGGDPLGLFESRRDLDQTAPFIVYPMTVPLDGVELPSGFLGGGQVIRRTAHFATSNVRSVRLYQPGDALSQIHWRTTARRRELYTKEFELDPVADFWIVLDMQRDVQVGEIDLEGEGIQANAPWLEPPAEFTLTPSTEEYAVSAAASLARRFLDDGKSVGLVAHAQRRIIVRPDRGERQQHKLLSTLAIARAAGRHSLSDVLSTETNEFTRNTMLVVVTPATTLRWIDGLRALRHRGVRSLVVLVEGGSFGAGPSSQPAMAALAANVIPTRILRNGEDIASALGGRARAPESVR